MFLTAVLFRGRSQCGLLADFFGERELVEEGVGVGFTFAGVLAEVEHLLY